MSERDEDGRYIPDHAEQEEAWDQRRARRMRTGCLCGWPDWPGQCPGPAHCPVHGQDLGE
jgi:hypothetical protein